MKKEYFELRIFICFIITLLYVNYTVWANKPTVMYLDFDKYTFTDKAAHYLNLLRSVSILHDSPEQAAQTVNDVYQDVETWWNNPTLQRNKEKFCDYYKIQCRKNKIDYVKLTTNTSLDVALNEYLLKRKKLN